jgi:hypothetical protein
MTAAGKAGKFSMMLKEGESGKLYACLAPIFGFW